MALLRSSLCEMERAGGLARAPAGGSFREPADSDILHGRDAADSGKNIHRENRDRVHGRRLSLWRKHAWGRGWRTCYTLDPAPPLGLSGYPADRRRLERGLRNRARCWFGGGRIATRPAPASSRPTASDAICGGQPFPGSRLDGYLCAVRVHCAFPGDRLVPASGRSPEINFLYLPLSPGCLSGRPGPRRNDRRPVREAHPPSGGHFSRAPKRHHALRGHCVHAASSPGGSPAVLAAALGLPRRVRAC